MPDLPLAPWESDAPAAPPPAPPSVPSAPWESSEAAGPEPYEKFQKSPLVPGRLQSAEPERPIGDTALARAAGAVPRLADYPEVAAQRNRQAREEMSQGLQNFKEGKSGVDTARGIGEMALGGLNYLYSPINAAFDVGVGQPVARTTGSPKAGQYASFGAQVIANPATVAAGLKHVAPETADSLARIFAPETRGPLAQQAAAIIREEGGLAAREQAAAFQELGEAREAQNIMQAGATAADHVAEDGTRYTASAREFTDYLDGKGAVPSNAKVAAAADAVKPWYQKVRGRIEGLPEGEKYRFLEQYFPIQISQKDKLRSPRGTPEAGGAAASSAGTGFLKGRRMYGSTSEVVDAGEHTLKTADPIKATYSYIMNAERFLATESVWQKARADGIVQYFMFGKQVPEGLAKIENGPHAQIHMPVGDAPWEGGGGGGPTPPPPKSPGGSGSEPIVAYHGTDKDFEQFDTSLTRGGNPAEKGATFFSKTPGGANNYAVGEGANVRKVNIDPKNHNSYDPIELLNNPETREGFLADLKNAFISAATRNEYLKERFGSEDGRRQLEALWELEKQKLLKQAADPYKEGLSFSPTTGAIIARAKREGADSATIKNLMESHGNDQIVVLNPERVTPFWQGESGHGGGGASVGGSPPAAAPKDSPGVMPMQAYAPEPWAKVWNRWQSQVPSDASLLTSARKFNSAATAYELGLNGYHATVMSMEAVVSDIARAAHKAATPGMRLGALPTAISAIVAPAKYAFRGGQGAREYVGRSAAPSKTMVAAGLRYGGEEAKQLTDLLSRAGARMATSGGQRSLDIAIPGGGPLFRARWKDITGAFERAARLAKGDKDALASLKGGIQRFGRAELADIKEHPVQTALGRPVFRAAFRILDTVAAPLFDEYIPRLKNGAMMSQLSDWMHANPDATMGQKLLAARKIVDSIDNRLGEMVHDNVFWTKTAKELAMAGMLSYSWNLGTLREVGGGLLEAPRAIAGAGKTLNLAGNTADLSFKGAYAIALPMVWGLYSTVYQYAKTGKAPEGIADLVNPQTGGVDPKSGKPERLATFGYMKDIAETYQKLVMEKAPLQLAWNKLNPGLLMFLEGGSVGMGMGGSNWRNDPITHPNLRDPLMVSMIAQAVEVAKDFAEEHAPISYKNIVERPKGTHIGIGERALLGMREASSFRVDPEQALLKKQKVIDSRSKAKESHIRKQKSLQEEGIGRHDW